jgi:hypothetical protein
VIAASDTAEEEPVTKSNEELEDKKRSQTPEDAQKNTRTAPPTVESEGNAAARGAPEPPGSGESAASGLA